MSMFLKWLFPFCLIIFLFGWGRKSKATLDYKETKTMVLDILKTDDGKKAIKEASKGSSGSSEEEGSMKTAEIESALQNSFSDPKSQHVLKEYVKRSKSS